MFHRVVIGKHTFCTSILPFQIHLVALNGSQNLIRVSTNATGTHLMSTWTTSTQRSTCLLCGRRSVRSSCSSCSCIPFSHYCTYSSEANEGRWDSHLA